MESQVPLQEKVQKPRRLSKKQKDFAAIYAATGNGQDAALKVYDIESNDPKNVARSIAQENLTKPAIIAEVEHQRETLKSALEKQGVTPTKIAKKIDKLLDSDDHNAVDKGLKHATNIYGVVDEPDSKPKGNTYNFILSPEVQADVKNLEARIKEKLIHAKEN